MEPLQKLVRSNKNSINVWVKIGLLSVFLTLETNQIHDYTYNGKFVKDEETANPQCVLCEFIMKEIDDKLKDKNDEVNYNCNQEFVSMQYNFLGRNQKGCSWNL